jgi:hypothetical protein
MRRIAISTPNVMAALRRLDRDRARPYNFAISSVLVNLSGPERNLLAPFETNPALWMKMPYIDIWDGIVHHLNQPTVPLLPQTFDIVFSQYCRHAEAKSLAPNGDECSADTVGLLRRFPITASGLHLIGKEPERLNPTRFGCRIAKTLAQSQFSTKRLSRQARLAEDTIRKFKDGRNTDPASFPAKADKGYPRAAKQKPEELKSKLRVTQTLR